MRYESIGSLSKKSIEGILYSSDFDDETKMKSLYTAIYEHDEDFASSMITHCMQTGVLNTPILAARSVQAFMQSRRSVVGSNRFLAELYKLLEECPAYKNEIQEIIEDTEELIVIFRDQ